MFKPVTRSENRLRLALDGPAGSGKTYTALRFAFAIQQIEGGRVAVIDTEHNSASLYAQNEVDGALWEWDGQNLEHFAPSTYAQVIEEAARQGYEILVIDSLSHAWQGTGGALEQVDRAQGQSGGRFGAWRDVTPQHNAMIDAIIRYPGHVIATLRTKMEYVLSEDERGKKRVEKIGMKPIQREGVEYEFTVVCDMDSDHRLTVSKTRCSLIDGKIVSCPGMGFIMPVIDWLRTAKTSPETTERIKRAAAACKLPVDQLKGILQRLGVERINDLPATEGFEFARRLEAKARSQKEESAPPPPAKAEPAPAPSKPTAPATGTMKVKGPSEAVAGEEEAAKIIELWKSLGRPAQDLRDFVEYYHVSRVAELPLGSALTLRRRLEALDMEDEAKAAF